MKSYTIQINHHLSPAHVKCDGMELTETYIEFYSHRSDRTRKTVAVYSIRNIVSVTVNAE
jgi:hypothetical protein